MKTSHSSSALDTHSTLSTTADPNKPESTLKAWLAILSVSLGAFALVTSEFLPVGVLNEISADLGISTGQAGLMITLPGIMAALAAPLLPVSIGSFDRRKLLILLTLTMVIANGIVAFSDSFSAILVGRLLLGIGIGGFWATAIALSARLAPKGVDVAKSTSIIMAGVTLATVLGVPLGTWLSGYFGWRATFAMTSAVGIIVLVFQMTMLPSLKPSKNIKMRDLPALFRNKKARIGLYAVLFIGLAHFAGFTYVAPFFKHAAGFNAAVIGSLLLLYGAAGVVGNIFAGFAAGKNLRLTFLSISIMLALSIALFPFVATHLYGAMALIALWGFAFGAFPTCASIWMFVSAPDAVEPGMPLFVGMFQVIIAAGSFFGGQIVDHWGMTNMLALATLSCIIGALIVGLCAKNIGQTTPNSTL